MIALRREATMVTHEDFMDAIVEVQAKKKANLNYYAWIHRPFFCHKTRIVDALLIKCVIFFIYLIDFLFNKVSGYLIRDKSSNPHY